LPDGRTEFPRSPVLSSREFNLQPVDSVGRLDYHTVSAYLEHRFSDDLFVEAAFNWLTNERWAYNETLYFNHWIDLNRVLPNGQPNPKFGVPFADAGLSRQMQRNDVPEGRVLANYKLDVDRIGLKQNISAIVGTRRGWIADGVLKGSTQAPGAPPRGAAGGHHIRSDKIRQRYLSAPLNLIRLMPHLAALRVYDNSASVPLGMRISPPRLVLHMKHGRIVWPVGREDVASVPEWAQPIVGAALAQATGAA